MKVVLWLGSLLSVAAIVCMVASAWAEGHAATAWGTTGAIFAVPAFLVWAVGPMFAIALEDS